MNRTDKAKANGMIAGRTVGRVIGHFLSAGIKAKESIKNTMAGIQEGATSVKLTAQSVVRETIDGVNLPRTLILKLQSLNDRLVALQQTRIGTQTEIKRVEKLLHDLTSSQEALLKNITTTENRILEIQEAQQIYQTKDIRQPRWYNKIKAVL